jgi:excinuclease ABC subunit A
MCPSTGIVSESRTKFIFFQFTKSACDHCNGLGTVNEITKDYSKSKIIDKSRWFCSLGEYKSSWIFKQLEIIGENIGFKLTDAVTPFGGSYGNDFEWWKEKFTINSKDLGVAENTKLILKDFAFHKK